MKFVRTDLIAATADASTVTSAAMDMNQVIKMSAQLVVGTGTATGSMQLQVSNDPVLGPFQDTTFTNWASLGSAVSVSGAGVSLIAEQDVCYRAMRAVYTNTTTQQQKITFSNTSPTAGHFVFNIGTGNATMNFDNDAAGLQVLIRLIDGFSSATVTGSYVAGFTITMTGVSPPPALGTITGVTLVHNATPIVVTNTMLVPTSSIKLQVMGMSV